MIAPSAYSTAATAKASASNIVTLTAAEVDAYMATQRAAVTRAWLEMAVRWRDVSKNYGFSDAGRRRARMFMRVNALRWKMRRAAR